MDAIVYSMARSCTNWCCWKGNQVIPAVKPGLQILASQSLCVPACRKLDGVAAWLMNGVAAAFFMSLERCYCIRVDTKDDDADDIQLLDPNLPKREAQLQQDVGESEQELQKKKF